MQAQFHLASVIVARQGGGDPAGCGAREDLRAMGQGNRRDTEVQTGHSLIKVRTAGAHIIDSGNGKKALFGLNHLMRVVQEWDPALPEDRLDRLNRIDQNRRSTRGRFFRCASSHPDPVPGEKVYPGNVGRLWFPRA